MSKKSKQGRGRPPGTPNLATMVRAIAAEPVTVRDATGRRTVSLLEAVVLRLQLKAAKGDLRCDKRLDAARARLTPPAAEPAALLVVPGMMEQDEWIRRENIMNCFRTKPEVEAPPVRSPPPDSSPPPTRPEQSRTHTPLPKPVPPRLIR